MTEEQELAGIVAERAERERMINNYQKAGKDFVESIASESERAAKLDEQRFHILEREHDKLQENLDIQMRAVMAAQAAIDAEKKHVESIQERIGRLNEVERIEAKSLAKKIADGTATDADYKRAEQLLGPDIVGDKASKHFAEKGAADAADIFGTVQGRDINERVHGAEQHKMEVEFDEGTGENREDQLRAKIDENQEKLKEAAQNWVDTVNRGLEIQAALFEKAYEKALEAIAAIEERAKHGK